MTKQYDMIFSPFLNLILIIIIFLFYILIYKEIRKPLTLKQLKTTPLFNIVLNIIFLLIFCLFLFYFMGNNYDLKSYFSVFRNIIQYYSGSILLFYLFIFLIIFVFVIMLLKLCKNFTYKHLLLLHFLIISKLKMVWLEETWYDKIRFQIYQKLYLNIILFPVNVLRFIKKIFNKCNEKQYDASDNIIASYYKFYGFFLALFLIIYDIFSNNFVLTKIYYLLPFLLFVDLHRTFLQDDEYDIACFLYVKLLHSTEDQLIYVNGHITTKENLDKIENLFKNNFDYTKIMSRIKTLAVPIRGWLYKGSALYLKRHTYCRNHELFI